MIFDFEKEDETMPGCGYENDCPYRNEFVSEYECSDCKYWEDDENGKTEEESGTASETETD